MENHRQKFLLASKESKLMPCRNWYNFVTNLDPTRAEFDAHSISTAHRLYYVIFKKISDARLNFLNVIFERCDSYQIPTYRSMFN